jgi:hypothetical protein
MVGKSAPCQNVLVLLVQPELQLLRKELEMSNLDGPGLVH